MYTVNTPVFQKHLLCLQISEYSNTVESGRPSSKDWVLKNPNWPTSFENTFDLGFQVTVPEVVISDIDITACLRDGQNQVISCASLAWKAVTSSPFSTTIASNTGSSNTATAQATTTASSSPSAYDYNDALSKSILFYEAQRSGKLPANNRIPWRGDSALNDQGQMGEDLTGGWYDAGDHVKFNFPQAASVTVLAWGILRFWDGYVKAGELDNVLDSIKWPLEYLLKCHVAPNKFYAQVGNGQLDHGYWGRPEDMTMARPAYFISAPNKPGSDLAGEVAAAMAASSLVFRKYNDTDYADILLGNATMLFDFADRYRGKYSDSVPEASNYYRSWSGYEDELAWSALWLYKATSDDYYLTKAANFNPWSTNNLFSWDDKTARVALMLYDITKKTEAKAAFERFVDNWASGKNGITITPKGLSWGLEWASLRYVSNAAFLALVAAKDGIQKDKGINFAIKQIHYALGDVGHSFICGFGVNPPQKPHHRCSSCREGQQCRETDSNPNPNILYGALVGGPDQNDVWVDDRTDYRRNEVAIDYNAGFQSSIAGLIDLATLMLFQVSVSYLCKLLLLFDKSASANLCSTFCHNLHLHTQLHERIIRFFIENIL